MYHGRTWCYALSPTNLSRLLSRPFGRHTIAAQRSEICSPSQMKWAVQFNRQKSLTELPDMNEPITDQLNAIEIMTFEDGDPNENPWVADKPKQEDISVEPYSPEWVAVFKSQREKIAHALGEAALAIEHVGSTAVLG